MRPPLVPTGREMATPLTAIPDHLLEDILLRLPDPEDLARAFAACSSFRRLVTDGSFLRRFRRVHAPPLLGFFDHNTFNPAIPPHPSAPGARAFARAAGFSFRFLPSHCRWAVQDIRGGRVLLVACDHGEEERRQGFSEIAVCDPLHRRHILLPPVPEDLASSVLPREHSPWCEHFLVPLVEESEEAFRVICVARFETRLASFVFSSSTARWQAAASKSWSDLLLGRGEPTRVSRLDPIISLKRHYAYGCFYWHSMFERRELLVLDSHTMEFSIIDFPPGKWRRLGLAIVGAGEGRLGMFGFHTDVSWDLRYTVMRNKAEIPSQWQILMLV